MLFSKLQYSVCCFVNFSFIIGIKNKSITIIRAIIPTNNLTQSVLTAKGLEVLKATPSSLTSSSFGQQLQEATSAGMLDTIKGLTNEALSRGIGLASSAAIAWVSSSS